MKEKIYKVLGKAENYNLKDRQLPTWNYYRDFDKGISIIEQEEVIIFFKVLISKNEREIIEGVNGKLILSEHIRSFISHKTLSKGFEIISSLESKEVKQIDFILLGNKAIIFGDKFILTFEELGGLQEFKIERDRVQERNFREFKLLFSPSSIKWKDKINDGEFENLVKDLLERENDVIWVRKVAHTNEADGGRDLIVKWKVQRQIKDGISQHSSPFIEKKIIVQCKAYKKGVGKSNVRDIRDIIEFNDYDGYFLVVSNYLKRSLTDHLDRMKNKGNYWIDWWTRQEIDERLKKNPDIIMKYHQLFEK